MRTVPSCVAVVRLRTLRGCDCVGGPPLSLIVWQTLRGYFGRIDDRTTA